LEAIELSPEQGNIIATALDGVKLRAFDMKDAIAIYEDEIFERIVSACWGVEHLKVLCQTDSKFTAVAALIRNPNAMLQDLTFKSESYQDDFDMRLALREIAASLAGNAKLKGLTLKDDMKPMDEFDNLLCDCTSLENICNSNHTLNAIRAPCDSHSDRTKECNHISDRTKDCLRFNKNQIKSEVIQNNIIQYYFIGEFELAPFASLPLSVLSEVMSLGEEMSNQQTAIFELLRGIPDLCNVSRRGVKEIEQGKTVGNLNFKRQRVHNIRFTEWRQSNLVL
jgi:hypothetical protein